MPVQMPREASTAATRTVIVQAARRLLAGGDWSRFTLEAVAAAAGVTRVTVYNQVGSKGGLLDAVLADLTGRAGMDRLLTDSRSMTPAAALRFVIERTCQFWHAERAVLRPLFGLSAVDRDIAANLAQRERWREDQLDRLLDRLAALAPVNSDLPRRSVLTGMLVLTSFATYDGLGVLADDPARAVQLIEHLISSLIGHR